MFGMAQLSPKDEVMMNGHRCAIAPGRLGLGKGKQLDLRLMLQQIALFFQLFWPSSENELLSQELVCVLASGCQRMAWAFCHYSRAVVSTILSIIVPVGEGV